MLMVRRSWATIGIYIATAERTQTATTLDYRGLSLQGTGTVFGLPSPHKETFACEKQPLLVLLEKHIR